MTFHFEEKTMHKNWYEMNGEQDITYISYREDLLKDLALIKFIDCERHYMACITRKASSYMQKCRRDK